MLEIELTELENKLRAALEITNTDIAIYKMHNWYLVAITGDIVTIIDYDPDGYIYLHHYTTLINPQKNKPVSITIESEELELEQYNTIDEVIDNIIFCINEIKDKFHKNRDKYQALYNEWANKCQNVVRITMLNDTNWFVYCKEKGKTFVTDVMANINTTNNDN